MPASSPLAPKLRKGAIVAVDQDSGAIRSSIAFQYNPQTVTRSLTPSMAPEQATQKLRFTGAPEETFSLKIVVDAVDMLERGDAQAASVGIYPQLAALEILVYPFSKLVADNDKTLEQGQIEILNPLYDAAMTLFVWGPDRIVPVQITSFAIAEENFDAELKPIRAEIDLSLRALSYSDLVPEHRGHQLFLRYQARKESLAAQGGTANLAGAIGFDLSSRI